MDCWRLEQISPQISNIIKRLFLKSTWKVCALGMLSVSRPGPLTSRSCLTSAYLQSWVFTAGYWWCHTAFAEGSQDVQTARGSVFMSTSTGGQESQRQTLLVYMWKTKPNQTSVPWCQWVVVFLLATSSFLSCSLTSVQGRSFRLRNMQKQQWTSSWTQ